MNIETERERPVVLAGEVIYGRTSTRVLGVEVGSQEEWQGISRAILAERSLHWSGSSLRGERGLLLFRTPCRSGALLPLVVEILLRGPQRLLVPAERPGLAWRMGALEFGRRVESARQVREEKWARNGEDQKAEPGETWIQYPAASALRFGDRAFTLRGNLLANPLAPDKALQSLVVALRAEYLQVDQLLGLTTLPRQRVLSFLNALGVAGLLEVKGRNFDPEGTPFQLFGLHWTAHEFEIRTRYRELLQSQVHPMGPIERAYDLLHQPQWRAHWRQREFPSPMINEVADYFRRQISRLRCTEERNLERIVDLSRRVLELSPNDRDVRTLLTALLARHRRHQAREGTKQNS